MYVEATNGQVSEVLNNLRHIHKAEGSKDDILSQHFHSMYHTVCMSKSYFLSHQIEKNFSQNLIAQ